MITALQAVTLVAPDLERSLEAYCGTLGYRLLDRSVVGATEAAGWGAPRAAGSPRAVLRAPAGPPVELRIIERPLPSDFDPLTCHGWYANEILIEDPDDLARRLRAPGSGFRLVGAPAPLASNPDIVALQALGPAGELLYFTRLPPTGGTFIRRSARAAVDGTFIVVVAGPNLETLQSFASRQFGSSVTAPFAGVVTPANSAFGRAAEATTRMALAPVTGDFAFELDELPPESSARQVGSDDLPPGWSLVTVRVDAWPPGPWRSPPRRRVGTPEADDYSGILVGAAGEWWEVLGVAPTSRREQAT